MNFSKLTMEFWYKSRKHLLRGAGKQVTSVGAGKLWKLAGNQSQLCMIQVIPNMSVGLLALETKDNTNKDPRIVSLIKEYGELFAEPIGLPPSRGIYDHKIVLQYPSIKKDVIEELVQQMLDQGISQPSSSPFASLVVLVGKKDGSWRL